MNWEWHNKIRESFANKFNKVNSKLTLNRLLLITFLFNLSFSLAYFLLPRYDDVFFGGNDWDNWTLNERIKPYCALLQYTLLALSFIFWTWTLLKYGHSNFADIVVVLLGFAPFVPSVICICWFAISRAKGNKKDDSLQSDSST